MKRLISVSLLAALQFLPVPAFSGPPTFKKVMIVVLENTSYSDAVAQPFLAGLAKQGALFTSFHAEAHPSLPNYIAMVAGDTLGVTDDRNVELGAKHLGDLLESKGKSWKIYAEDFPGDCFTGAIRGRYARKHVPFLSFKNVLGNPARCAKIVNASQLDADMKAQSLPDFSMLIPNLDNDGHDTGPRYADQWLSKTFGRRIQDPSIMSDLLLVVTFDEADAISRDNQIYTVFVGAGVMPGSRVVVPTSHYSILRTIEDTFGLGTLGRGDASATAIAGIWR